MKKVKGTRDFYPEQKSTQNYIFNTWKNIARSYNFKEIEGPILEPIEIYSKSGQEIPEQMYTLTDKSKRKLALRPETTPTIARMIKQNPNLKKPIKWFSISRCFRYEAPQTGRLREFFQLNLDTLGSKSMLADAEIITTSIKIMLAFNLSKKDFYIRISNRKLMESLLTSIKIPKPKFKTIYRLIDKICKISKKDFELTLKKNKLNEKQIKEVFKILNLKTLNIKYKLDKNGQQGLKELKELFSYLKKFNVLQYCKLDLSIMRGFDYYTSTVFEVFDSKGKFRAIAGGGRYDNLANLPGVGYGMGDAVLELFLKSRNKLPKLTQDLDYYIAPTNEKMIEKAIKIAEKLRKTNSVELDLMSRSLSKQLDYANSINAKKVVIVGEKDFPKVTVRDMKTGKEKLLTVDEVIKYLKK